MNLFRPELFQGSLTKKSYFEGWYIKTVFGSHVFALIPGISLGKDSHAFIQLIDGSSHRTHYLRYPLEEFSCDPRRFAVRIGKSRFSAEGVELDLEGPELRLTGFMHFSDAVGFPRRWYSPGIMGPFSFIPFMECYHGVVSIDHRVEGHLNWNDRERSFSDGRGYIEKDWGRSMPSSWIWLQSNGFPVPGTSFLLSVAKIPWGGRSFVGHLGFFYHEGCFHRFATYNGSRIFLEDESEKRKVTIRRAGFSLVVRFPRADEGGVLQAPVNGEMQRAIRERTDAEIDLEYRNHRTGDSFQGTGRFAGIEQTGDSGELFP